MLGIDPIERRRFEQGREPHRLWEYLEVRDRLDELREALRVIGRRELADYLVFDGDPPFSPVPNSGNAPVDRVLESDRLRAALLGGDKPVILVHGDTGIGKSELVDFTIDGLSREYTVDQLQIRRHQLGPGARITTAGLIEDIEDRASRTLQLRSGESLPARLRLALQKVGDRRVVIVVDGAQYLMDGPSHAVTLDLDEALQVLTEHRTHNIRVVLVTTVFPASGAGTRWLSKAEIVSLGRLPSEHVITLFRILDRDDTAGLRDLNDDVLAELGDLVDGNPRQIKLMTALLDMGSGISLPELTEALSLLDWAQRERALTERLIAELKPQQRKILESLAVFAVPVPPEVITSMLADRLPTWKPNVTPSDAILRWLTKKRLIAVTSSDHLFLRTGAAGLVLKIAAAAHGLPADRARAELARRAANALSDHRTPDDSIENLPDLDLHFEELRLWLEAGHPGVAYERIDKIHQVLQRWNRGGLLLEARESVRGKLGRPFLEMANLNALGEIYRSQGLVRDAKNAFEATLNHAATIGWTRGRQKIMTNLGSLSWEDNDASAAEARYADALALAQENCDDHDEMLALEGLANCRRRRGVYTSALDLGRKALAAAQRIGNSRAVVLATRMSRWYTEIGDDNSAERLLRVAEEEARSHRDLALTARCLDARADLRLAQGERTEAIVDATSAVNAALAVGDPVTLLQARTTLGVAYLENEDAVAAAREIRDAVRYRPQGRSLILLAFEAVLDLRANTGEAGARFQDLESEAAARIGSAEGERPDFAAWDLRAIAVCGLRGDDFAATAVDYFTRARCGSDLPVPGLTARLELLLRQIERYGGETDLGPVIAAAKRPCPVHPFA